MRALTQREKSIALALGACLFIWLMVGVWHGHREAEDDLRGQQDVLVEKIRRQKQLIGQAPAMKKALEGLTSRIGTAAGDGEETAAIIKSAERAAMAYDIHLVNIQPKRTDTQGQLKVFAVEITVEGPWSAVTDFIQTLQASPNDMDIESMRLEKYSDKTVSLRGVMVIKRWRVVQP